jgi:hypothetical protein
VAVPPNSGVHALVGVSGGEAGNGLPVSARTASTGRSKGGGVHGLEGSLSAHGMGKERPRGAASGSNVEGRATARDVALRRAGARTTSRSACFRSDRRCLTTFCSNILNRSAPSDE